MLYSKDPTISAYFAVEGASLLFYSDRSDLHLNSKSYQILTWK